MVFQIKDNPKASRYETEVEGKTAFAEYTLTGNTLTITHIKVPKPLEGRGIAKRLMDTIVADAKERKLTIVPVCSYAAAYMERRGS